MNDTAITVTEATKILNVSGETVKRWLRKGKLKGYKAEGQWFVQTDDSIFERQVNDKCATSEQQLFHTCVADESLKSENARLHQLLESQTKQIETLTQQIDHLTQIVAMSQKNIAALTEQLFDSRQVISDMRRRTLWQRLRAVFIAQETV